MVSNISLIQTTIVKLIGCLRKKVSHLSFLSDEKKLEVEIHNFFYKHRGVSVLSYNMLILIALLA